MFGLKLNKYDYFHPLEFVFRGRCSTIEATSMYRGCWEIRVHSRNVWPDNFPFCQHTCKLSMKIRWKTREPLIEHLERVPYFPTSHDKWPKFVFLTRWGHTCYDIAATLCSSNYSLGSAILGWYGCMSHIVKPLHRVWETYKSHLKLNPCDVLSYRFP